MEKLTRTVKEYYDEPPITQVPHYVFGRTLTPEDLKRDRETALRHLEQLAHATGTGIAYGLWVEAQIDDDTKQQQLVVSNGIGINKVGHPIVINSEHVTIDLPPNYETSPGVQNAAVFSPCGTIILGAVPDGSELTFRTGPYLLTALPVYRLSDENTFVYRGERFGYKSDHAFRSRDNGAGFNRCDVDEIDGTCESLWEEEGIAFRIVYLGFTGGFEEPGSDELRRNALAHWSFGTRNMPGHPRNPFSAWDDLSYSGLDSARAILEKEDRLTKCDLPLAVFYWEDDGIQYVDNWTVRRRLAQRSKFYLSSAEDSGRDNFYAGWGQQVSDQLAAEGEARFMQFQDQLEGLRKRPEIDIHTLKAKEYFQFLPPAGYLPLCESETLKQSLGYFVIDLFLMEVKRQLEISLGSHFFWDTPSFMILAHNNVSEAQMNELIAQVNTVFGTLKSSANTLAKLAEKPEISFDLIGPVEELEVTADGHVILWAWNERILPEINTQIESLEKVFTQLADIYGDPEVSLLRLEEITGVPVFPHEQIEIRTLNNDCLLVLDQVVSYAASSLNVVGSFLTDLDSLFFTSVREHIYDLAKGSIFTLLEPHARGVRLEDFFDQQDDVPITVQVVDRKSITHLLESSFRDPAIDVEADRHLTLYLPYENVIPYVVSMLRGLIDYAADPFGSQNNNLRLIWFTKVRDMFDVIVNSHKDVHGLLPKSQPLFGLFARSKFP